MNRSDIHARWKAADHDLYKMGQERTLYLLSIILQYAKPDAKILELGCNVGRNLNGLLGAGFTDLHGVEINPNTDYHRRKVFPELVKAAHFHYMPIEEYIILAQNYGIGMHQYDLVYTMAVLEHLHPDSEWVLDDLHTLVKPGGYLIIIEDEKNRPGLDFVFPRSYGAIKGLDPVLTEDCGHIPGLENSRTMRIFERPHRA